MENKRFISSEKNFLSVSAPELSKKLDYLFAQEFSSKFRLWAWSYIDNIDNFNLLRPEIGGHPETAIVIQGGIDNLDLILFILKRYVKLYPDSIIIVSTWNDIEPNILLTLEVYTSIYTNCHIVINHKPKFKGYGGMNTNLQIISAIAGIKKAKELGAKYVLKIRSDIVIGSLHFLSTLKNFHSFFSSNILPGQKGRIIVDSMNTYRCRPFSVSDHFSFGYISDMVLMWTLELPTSNETMRNVSIIGRTGNEFEPMSLDDAHHLGWSAKPMLMDEAYLVSSLMNASQISYTFDWVDSKKFLARGFIILDSILDLYFIKPNKTWATGSSKFRNAAIPNFATSRFGQSEISFSEWLGWYIDYCS